MTLDTSVAKMRGAATCDDCFKMGIGLVRAFCNVAQPRWIGTGYFSSSPRVVVALINPGGGGSSATPALRAEADLFREFYRTGDYDVVRAYFGDSIQRGDPWWRWYQTVLGLEHDQIAQINVAWCPTKSNRYPLRMLRHCFQKHTSGLLAALAPNVVLLSGSAIHVFAPELAGLLPTTTIIPTLHYAHRKSRAEERAEGERVKRIIAQSRVERDDGRHAS